MGSTPRNSTFKRRHHGVCAREGCDYFGPLWRGLCKRDFDRLMRDVDRLGYDRPRLVQPQPPLVCTCGDDARPQPVRVWGHDVVLPGAPECGRCFRPILAGAAVS